MYERSNNYKDKDISKSYSPYHQIYLSFPLFSELSIFPHLFLTDLFFDVKRNVFQAIAKAIHINPLHIRDALSLLSNIFLALTRPMFFS